ncbi:MAG: GAF domain-containing protein [Candidatus Acidiferrales bacterium]
MLDSAPAAPMASEHIGELKKWVAELARLGGEGEAVRLNRAVELIAKNFGVQTHEVAILGFSPDERSLRFLAPDNLRPVGEIPMSSITSLAVRTARERRPEVVNHFSMVPHASVFEGVPVGEDQRTDPIQKIMSAPIMLGSRVVGVVQVSRKAGEAAEAGPDFTQAQLRELGVVCEALAPCVILCRAK